MLHAEYFLLFGSIYVDLSILAWRIVCLCLCKRVWSIYSTDRLTATASSLCLTQSFDQIQQILCLFLFDTETKRHCQQEVAYEEACICICMCSTMSGCGCLSGLALLCRDASCPSVFLAVPRTVGLVVTMALPGHSYTHKQSPVAWRRNTRKVILHLSLNNTFIHVLCGII